MMSATTTTPTTTAKPTRRGFGDLPCPLCGSRDGIWLALEDLTAPDALACIACNEAFGAQEVRDWIASWAPALAWIEQAPTLEG